MNRYEKKDYRDRRAWTDEHSEKLTGVHATVHVVAAALTGLPTVAIVYVVERNMAFATFIGLVFAVIGAALACPVTNALHRVKVWMDAPSGMLADSQKEIEKERESRRLLQKSIEQVEVQTVDRSGITGMPGKSTIVMAVNPNRTTWSLQSQSSGVLWLCFTGEAIVGKCFKISPGGGYDEESGTIHTGEIHITSEMAGQSFVAFERSRIYPDIQPLG